MQGHLLDLGALLLKLRALANAWAEAAPGVLSGSGSRLLLCGLLTRKWILVPSNILVAGVRHCGGLHDLAHAPSSVLQVTLDGEYAYVDGIFITP